MVVNIRNSICTVLQIFKTLTQVFSSIPSFLETMLYIFHGVVLVYGLTLFLKTKFASQVVKKMNSGSSVKKYLEEIYYQVPHTEL